MPAINRKSLVWSLSTISTSPPVIGLHFNSWTDGKLCCQGLAASGSASLLQDTHANWAQ
jgi:hypothetical protein